MLATCTTTLLSKLLTALMHALMNVTVYACPMCGKALEQDGQAGFLQGIQWSWLLLASVPLLMVGTFVTVAVRTYRNAQRVIPTAVVKPGIPDADPLAASMQPTPPTTHAGP